MKPANGAAVYSLPASELGIRAAGIAYRAGDKVLLVKRAANSEDHPETWAFPAGKVEDGETPLQTAVRESFEEIGYRPEALPEFVEISAGGFCLFRVKVPEFVPTLNEEHSAYVWAAPGALPEPLHPGVAVQVGGHAMDESARQNDVNGWTEIARNPISKIGVFPYLGRQIGNDAEPERIFHIYRPAEELGAPECLDSFRLLPFVNDHTMIGPSSAGLTPAEQKGIHGVIGENVEFDGTYLRGNLKVFSDSLAALIESGKQELSAGYRCKYDMTPGEFGGVQFDGVQRMIRGNHLALVDEGRMGPDVAVLDHLTFTLDATGGIMPDPIEQKAEPTLGEVVAMLAAIAPQVEQLMAFMTKLKPLEEAEHGALDTPAPAGATETPAPAAETPAAILDPVEDKGAGMDEATLIRNIARRDVIYEKGSRIVGAFDHKGKTLAEVAKYLADKLEIGTDSVEGVEAYLKGVASATAQTVTVTAQDAAPRSSEVDAYITGAK